MLWSSDTRILIRNNNPGISNSEVSVLLGKLWHDMSDKDKINYKNKAEKIRCSHKLKFPDYKYKPKQKKIKQNNENFKICKTKIIKYRKKKHIDIVMNCVDGVDGVDGVDDDLSDSTETDNEKKEEKHYEYHNVEPDYFTELQLFYQNISFEI